MLGRASRWAGSAQLNSSCLTVSLTLRPIGPSSLNCLLLHLEVETAQLRRGYEMRGTDPKTPHPATCLLAACSTPSRLRLVAAANVRLTVCAAFRRALRLVFLRQLLLAHLVAVIGYFASLRSLFVARVLLGFHMGFLHSLVQVQGAWPSPIGPISL